MQELKQLCAYTITKQYVKELINNNYNKCIDIIKLLNDDCIDLIQSFYQQTLIEETFKSGIEKGEKLSIF